MTAIVGMIDNDNDCVWIGGDSCGGDTESWTEEIREDPKVFNNNGYLFGFTSSFRMGDLLKYEFKPPKPYPPVDARYMVKVFIPKLRNCLIDYGFASIKNNVERGGLFLVAYANQLFTIGNNFQVGKSLNGYNAVGCGRDIALGALHALNNTNYYSMSVKDKVHSVLLACEHHSAYVRKPFIIERTK